MPHIRHVDANLLPLSMSHKIQNDGGVFVSLI